ncbi:hypothetical protein BROUX41_001184 [Berkeleyomyces rouxiae]|uniref:uncharacterized protein n=1 Tax=Berkeleyomyces rouxiae TaxID=2035830 RepID=UPI003B7DDCE5
MSSYDGDEMDLALESIANGRSIRRAAIEWGIPRRVLQDESQALGIGIGRKRSASPPRLSAGPRRDSNGLQPHQGEPQSFYGNPRRSSLSQQLYHSDTQSPYEPYETHSPYAGSHQPYSGPPNIHFAQHNPSAGRESPYEPYDPYTSSNQTSFSPRNPYPGRQSHHESPQNPYLGQQKPPGHPQSMPASPLNISAGSQKPPTGPRKTPSGSQKPPSGPSKPPVNKPNPPGTKLGKQKPPPGQPKGPGSQKPTPARPKALAGIQKPPSIPPKPPTGPQKPAAGPPKPPTGPQKPAVGGPKPPGAPSKLPPGQQHLPTGPPRLLVGPQKLSAAQEKRLANWIEIQGHLRIQPLAMDLREFAERTVRLEGGTETFGKNWPTSFLRRNPNARVYRSRYCAPLKFRPASVDNIRDWFRGLQIPEIESMDPANKWNMDEVSIIEDQGLNGLILGFTERINVQKKQSQSRAWVTMFEAVNATGRAISPMVIYKGEPAQQQWFHLDIRDATDWASGSSDDESPSTEEEVAVAWLREVFIPATTPANPHESRLLILEGRPCFETVDFMFLCYINRIYVTFLPHHSSHLLQPLDLNVFPSMKTAYRNEVGLLDSWDDATVEGKRDLFACYRRARQSAMTTDHIRTGFRNAGIWPLNITRSLDSPLMRVGLKWQVPSKTDSPPAWDRPLDSRVVPPRGHQEPQVQARDEALDLQQARALLQPRVEVPKPQVEPARPVKRKREAADVGLKQESDDDANGANATSDVDDCVIVSSRPVKK